MTTEIQTAERPQQVAERLTAVRQQIEGLFVEVGELLLEAHQNGYHAQLGYATFEDFVQEKLEIGQRKALYLADCFRVYVKQLGISKESLAATGWSKAAIMLPIAKRAKSAEKVQEVKEMMEAAVTKTSTELSLEVRRKQAPPGMQEQARKYDPQTFGLWEDEAAIVKEAVALAKLEAQTERDGTALVHICADYLAEAKARQQESQ